MDSFYILTLPGVEDNNDMRSILKNFGTWQSLESTTKTCLFCKLDTLKHSFSVENTNDLLIIHLDVYREENGQEKRIKLPLGELDTTTLHIAGSSYKLKATI